MMIVIENSGVEWDVRYRHEAVFWFSNGPQIIYSDTAKAINAARARTMITRAWYPKKPIHCVVNLDWINTDPKITDASIIDKEIIL